MPHACVRLTVGSLLAITVATALGAQSAAHLGVRGVLQTGPTGVQRLFGASTQLDFTARERLDVRFHAGVASGSRRGLAGCPLDPSLNCTPREVHIDNRRTTIGVALPVRLTRRGALDVRLVPGLEGHRLDESPQVGVSLGLESRYRRSPASHLEFVAAADVRRANELGLSADAPTYDGAFTTFSVGARYRFYTRR